MLSELRFWRVIVLPGDFPTLANLIFGAGNPLALLFDDSSSSSDSADDSQDIDDDNEAFDHFVDPLEGMRLPRSCMTYAHDGDMLGNNDSTQRDTAKNWNNLKAVAYDFWE